jgi:hypothetical protein
MSYIGALAAARIGAKKNIEKKIRRKGAVSVETAITPEEAGITSKRELGWLNRLVKEGKIKETSDGRYYIECEDGKYC